jgi:release factor glutamine methyltransferase
MNRQKYILNVANIAIPQGWVYTYSFCMFAGMTSAEAIKFISSQLAAIYENGEATAIGEWVVEYITGLSRQQRYSSKLLFTAAQEQQFHSIIARLQQHEPVQYVLNETWFCGLKFYTDKNVLIPRPETEELTEWIISNCKFPLSELKILDIGTGSGCIPVSLKRRLRKTEVWGIDISEAALNVAQKNATALGTDIYFVQADILDASGWSSLPVFDIIVSNPPYIPEKNKSAMQPNVLHYEPAAALFVPDDDALLFYKAIAVFAKEHLNKGGLLYFEIHEDLGPDVIALLESQGYVCELKKDMQQKDRMVKGNIPY